MSVGEAVLTIIAVIVCAPFFGWAGWKTGLWWASLGRQSADLPVVRLSERDR
mgnify:CR=1 FL=1